MSWDISVPIFKNSLILKQLGLAIGIPFGILTAVLLIFGGYYALILIGALFVLAFIFIMIIFRGTYDVSYELTDKKVLCRNQAAQRKKVEGFSAILYLLGMLHGNPTTMGIALMSQSRTTEGLAWNRVRKVRYNNKQRYIMLNGGFGVNIVIFCDEGNYEQIKSLVGIYTGKHQH